MAAWPDPDAAGQALRELKQAKREHLIGILDVATLVVDDEGKLRIKDTKDRGAGEGAVIGGVLGAALGLIIGGLGWLLVGGGVIGALAARARDGGLPDARLRELGDRMTPNSSAIVAVIEDRRWVADLQRGRRRPGRRDPHRGDRRGPGRAAQQRLGGRLQRGRGRGRRGGDRPPGRPPRPAPRRSGSTQGAMTMTGSDITGRGVGGAMGARQATDAAATSELGGWARGALVVFGVLAGVLGVALLINPLAAVGSLATLAGFALIVAGILEIVSPQLRRRGVGVLLGVLLLVAGFLALLWPDITLWMLALIVGIGLVVHGVTRVVTAYTLRTSLPGWGWVAAIGVLNVVVGVLALAWPGVTIFALAVLLGVQILVFGVLTVVAAFRYDRTPAGAAPAV